MIGNKLILIICLIQARKSVSVQQHPETKDLGPNELTNESDCFIQNQHYAYTFLSQDISLRSLHRLRYQDFNLENIRWSLTKVKGSKNRYYVRPNKSSNIYLCGFEIYSDIFKTRRKISKQSIKNVSHYDFKQCEWRFEKLPASISNHSYAIWNQAYNEPMYAPSVFFNKGLHQRNGNLFYLISNLLKLDL
jgi:hypothetical protein